LTPVEVLSRSEIRSVASFLRKLRDEHASRSIQGIAKEHQLPEHTIGEFLREPGTMRVRRATLEAIAHAVGPEFTWQHLLRRPAQHIPPSAPPTAQRCKRTMVVRPPGRA
jgi:hypothetical protein